MGSSCGIGVGGFEVNGVAEALEPANRAADDVLAIAFVEVGLAEILVDGTASQQVVGRDQDAVADGDNGALFAAPRAESSKQGWQIGVFGLAGGPRRFSQRCPQPGAAFARASLLALAATLPIARAHARPGGDMASGRKAFDRHADLDQNDLGSPWTHASDAAQPFKLSVKRAKQVLHLGVAGGDLCFQVVQVLQLLLDDETQHVAQATNHCLLQRLALVLQDPMVRQFSQLLRVALTLEQGLEDALPRDTGHVAEHGCQLDVGAFERLLQSIHLGRPLVDQRGPIAYEFAQLALVPIRNEARTQQTMTEQIGNPLGIFDVGFAAWHGLQVLRVDDQQGERLALLQDVVDRLPVDPSGFHRYVGAATLDQPLAQGFQVGCHRPKGAHFLVDHALRRRAQHTRDNRLLVHVQPGTPLVNNVHLSPPAQQQNLCLSRSRDATRSDSPTRAHSNSQRCLQASRAILRNGLTAPVETRPRCPATPPAYSHPLWPPPFFITAGGSQTHGFLRMTWTLRESGANC